MVGSVSVALAIAMLVAWILALVWSDRVEGETWLLVLGIISLSFIGLVLGGFMVMLVREMREVRRHTTFIDSVTHELKTPLSSLRLCLETLDRAGLSAEQVHSLRGMMRGDIDRLASFIDDVLVANRVGPGMEHAAVMVPLRETVQRCADRALAVHHLGPEAVAIDVPADLTLRTDPTAVETIFLNLIDNALKYSDPPVQVRVVARAVGPSVQVTVVDHGIGLTPADARRIFQRFYRVESEAVRRRKGTGLGLFVVAGLVRSLRGRISATSPGPGQGTSVMVQLPSAHADASAHPRSSHAPLPRAPSSSAPPPARHPSTSAPPEPRRASPTTPPEPGHPIS